MSSLGPHILFFLLVSAVIVLMGCFYSEAQDGPALRAFPRRYLVFVFSCALVAGVMLILEYVFAWVR